MKMKSKVIPGNVLVILIGMIVFIFYFLLIELLLNYAATRIIAGSLDNNNQTNFLDSLENISLDQMMKIRNAVNRETAGSKHVSGDIVMIGIADKSMKSAGAFSENVNAKLTDFCTAVNGNNLLFFDTDIIGDVNDNSGDETFIDSIRKNGNVIFGYKITEHEKDNEKDKIEIQKRIDFMDLKFGGLKNISGTFTEAAVFKVLTPPSVRYMDVLRNAGAGIGYGENGGNIRNYPLVIKNYEMKDIDFSDLKSGDYYDSINVDTFRISYDKNHECILVRSLSPVFDQTGTRIKDRKILSRNNIYTIKDRMDKLTNDFQLELDNFRSIFEKQNRGIIKKIMDHLSASVLPDESKDQIRQVFANDDNIKDTDELLSDLCENLRKISLTERKFDKEELFFRKLYDKCLKIDRNTNNSIFDYLYKDKKFYFDKLLVSKEKYFKSVPLILACGYYNVKNDDVEVIYGKEIRLRNPSVYNTEKGAFEKPKFLKNGNFIGIPIDNRGFVRINYTGGNSVFNKIIYSGLISGTNGYHPNNKILMVTSNTKRYGIYNTPMKPMSGIEIDANALNTIITNHYIFKPDRIFNFILLLLVSLIFAYIFLKFDIKTSYLLIFVFFVLYCFFAIVLFSITGFAVEMVRIILISIASAIGVNVYRNVKINPGNQG
jgi:CHASE2 domain-containing sensor protein